MPHRKIYEVVVCDTEGNAIDSVYFNSHKAAKAYKPEYGHTTLICEWPLFTIKDIKPLICEWPLLTIKDIKQ